MRFLKIIGKEEEERVEVHAKEDHPYFEDIRHIVDSHGVSLVGTLGEKSVLLDPSEVICFLIDNGKVYAMVGEYRYQMKERLYQLEEMPFSEDYVKINQSCLANIGRIKEFKSSIGGSIMVVFQNGHVDYISRRELKRVKERIGL